MRPQNDNSSPAVLHFPRRNILSPREASHYLGIRPSHLRAMKWLRCGPKPISINRQTLYTEAELRDFRLGLLHAVGVEEQGGPYREIHGPPRHKRPGRTARKGRHPRPTLCWCCCQPT